MDRDRLAEVAEAAARARRRSDLIWKVDAIEVKSSGIGLQKKAIGFKAKLQRVDEDGVTWYATIDLPYDHGYPLPDSDVGLRIDWVGSPGAGE